MRSIDQLRGLNLTQSKGTRTPESCPACLMEHSSPQAASDLSSMGLFVAERARPRRRRVVVGEPRRRDQEWAMMKE